MRKHRGETFAVVKLGDRDQHVNEGLARIDLDNLHDETQETGAEAVWYGVVAARARRLAREAELTLKVTEAVCRKEADAAAAQPSSGREKLTVDQRKDQATLDPRYKDAALAWIEAEERAEIAESAKFAVVRKQEHLAQLSALLLQEEAARRGRTMTPYIPAESPTRPARRQPVIRD